MIGDEQPVADLGGEQLAFQQRRRASHGLPERPIALSTFLVGHETCTIGRTTFTDTISITWGAAKVGVHCDRDFIGQSRPIASPSSHQDRR
jgi:hypothetical protein